MTMRPARPRLLVPEVVQTSAMDCGPAALTCLLGGFGIQASYGRLREACQTDVDGTSIDTLEEVANELGLIAEQVIVPVDHVLLPRVTALPAIAVVVLPNGFTHFVVAWRRHGPFVQLMDPAAGRRWRPAARFESDLFVHRARVPASAWREWAGSENFLDGLKARAESCGVKRRPFQRLIDSAASDPHWRSLGALDAAVRMAGALARSRAFGSRSEATNTLERLFERARRVDAGTELIPDAYWSVRPAPSSESEEQVVTRGAVLLAARGVREDAARATERLTPALAAALREPPARPYRHLFQLLRADGALIPGALAVALFVAALGVIVEAILLGNLIDIGHYFALQGQRFGAVAALLILVSVLLALEVPIANAVAGLGRRLEARLRVSFLEKLPRLGDRYFSSRPSSDMAERSHNTHSLRLLPDLGAQLVRAIFELLLTAMAIAFVFPGAEWLTLLGLILALVPPFIAQPVTSERDLRFRTHTGALARFYFDAFIGAVAIRAHGAEGSVRREHEALLTDWVRAGYHLLRTITSVEAIQLALGIGVASSLLFSRVGVIEESGGLLLLTYWALNVPLLGQEIAQVVSQYPMHRNLTLRLLEPLGAVDQSGAGANATAPSTVAEPVTSPGVKIEFRKVVVKVGGHTVLDGVDFEIASGAHVAIVGASGAGKSTLVGVLLGWHTPIDGVIRVDEAPLDANALAGLRRQTAWIDPAVWLWNRSLLENVEYGWPAASTQSPGSVVSDSELTSVVERLPIGLQTTVGEGGALLSGGEGQRVRYARALGRTRARLVILDEPFRGLERDRRARLLDRTRRRWASATLLCATHDISEAMRFQRVLVLEGGRIVEYADPESLARDSRSRFRALLDAEAEMHLRFADSTWREIVLDGGRMQETKEERVRV